MGLSTVEELLQVIMPNQVYNLSQVDLKRILSAEKPLIMDPDKKLIVLRLEDGGVIRLHYQ